MDGMEKHGEIRPGTTPDNERKLPAEKRAAASTKEQIKQLDNDQRKEFADRVADKLR